MTFREAFAQVRQAAAAGWFLVRWQTDGPYTLDDEVQFMELPLNVPTEQPGLPPELVTPELPCLPPELVATGWHTLCSSRGFQTVVRQTDARAGGEDDEACLVAVLWCSLYEDVAKDAEALAADMAVSGRRSHARAYWSRSGRGVVLAAEEVAEDMMRYEADGAVLIPSTARAASVGRAVLEVLSRYHREPTAPRNRKKTELPAFRASGHKSFRAFEQDVVGVSLERDEQRLTMIPRDRKGSAVAMIHLPATCPVEEIGRRLMQLAQRVAKRGKTETPRREAARQHGPNTQKSRSKR